MQFLLTKSGFLIVTVYHDPWELYNLLHGPSGILHVNIPIPLSDPAL